MLASDRLCKGSVLKLIVTKTAEIGRERLPAKQEMGSTTIAMEAASQDLPQSLDCVESEASCKSGIITAANTSARFTTALHSSYSCVAIVYLYHL